MYLTFGVLILVTTYAQGATIEAECIIESTSGKDIRAIEGTVTLTQEGSNDVSISVDISGFETGDNGANRGFHVHANGELGNQCSDAGGHYNPRNKLHGGPTAAERHVGDLGNLQVANQKLVHTFTDTQVKLTGDESVIGKAIVVHAGEDDLGLGTEIDSNTTGHAGARLGCCLIKEKSPTGGSTVLFPSAILVFLVSLFLTRF